MKHRLALVLLVVFVIGGRSAPAVAQNSATMSGVAQSILGGALPGTRITIRQVDTGGERVVVANADGRFVASGLPAGPYEIRAELSGFARLVRSGVTLTVGETAAVTLTLLVGTQESVTVSAAAPIVDTGATGMSDVVDQLTMAEIPVNGRNYTELMSLLPGVNVFAHRDNGSVVAHGLAMSVNGQDPRANAYLLDGTLLNDFTNGPAGSAAGTALGMDTVLEFRLQSTTYSAEFGRYVGGQVNAITKSGANRLSGSGFEYFRHDALDARNVFDTSGKPAFIRNQFGGTLGGPIRRDRIFFFGGYEALKETLGRTIVTTVPDDNARVGILPGGVVIPVAANVAPYLAAFPRANGDSLGGGMANATFPFDQRLDQHFAQGRVDAVAWPGAQFFARYTFDDANQWLPTDYPQFPRSFVSRNQFLTTEYRQAGSSWFQTVRFGYSRTRIGQVAQGDATLPVFVPGRSLMGAIDIGGFPRFGTQVSSDVRLSQDVSSLQYDATWSKGRHLVKAGAVAEHYLADEYNPTFGLGVFRFASLATFLRGTATQFIGLTPQGDVQRTWPFTVFGAYVQDDWRVRPSVTLSAGVRVEGSTMPIDRGGRDVNMRDLRAAPVLGPLYDNPAPSFSPRVGAVWNVGGNARTVVRGGYGLYFNTNNQQNLIITVSNPPATPRVVIANPTFPVPPFERGTGISVRPMQYDIALPRVHMWNVNVQRELLGDWMVLVGYTGSRGRHLWRNSDVNVPAPEILADGTPYYRAGLTRPNPSYSAIELKASDGDSWHRALVVEVKKRWSHGLQLQSSYTWSKSEDTTQNSTFFSDSTTASTSAMPEFIPNYNRGLSDFNAEHTFVANFVWEPIPSWRVSGIVRMRSGNPITPFVQTNRSRSLWSPSLGPGTGPDRPSYAAGYSAANAVTGNPLQWFVPNAFVLQPAGTFGNVGRNELLGPDLKTVDLAFSKFFALRRLPADRARLELRVEVFNALNRPNYGPPSLVAFSGTSDNEAPLASFGQIRTTVTSARQVQLGVRLSF